MDTLKQGDKLHFTSGKIYEVTRVANHGIFAKPINEILYVSQAALKRELSKKK